MNSAAVARLASACAKAKAEGKNIRVTVPRGELLPLDLHGGMLIRETPQETVWSFKPDVVMAWLRIMNRQSGASRAR